MVLVYSGELLLWDLSVPGKQQSPKHFTGRNDCRAHTRIVFNLVPAGKDGTALCSISMDRNVCTSLHLRYKYFLTVIFSACSKLIGLSLPMKENVFKKSRPDTY